jgi:acyl-CoA thioesterase-1
MAMRVGVALAVLLLACSSSERDSALRTRHSAAAASDSHAQPSPESRVPATDAKHTILFVGTSLTAGYGLDDPAQAYPGVIARRIDSLGLSYDVVNAGVSGETSAGTVRRLDWLMRQPFDVFVLETGANDGLRGLSVDSLRANIQTILDRVRATHPEAKVLLVGMEAPPNLGAAYARAFHEAYPALARANHVAFLPFLLTDVAGVPALNQADGIHPNARGARIIADHVWTALRPLLNAQGHA